MTEFIVLNQDDVATLFIDKPVTIYIDKKPCMLCTDKYFEKQMKGKMTKEAARAILEEIRELDDSIYQYSEVYMEALDIAIEALSKEDDK